jgi:spermidine synthase
VTGPVVVDRLRTPRGELALRRSGDHYELISNGVFLMDTRDGRSERLLAQAALAACAGPPARPLSVLVAGLGVGFTLRAALDCSRVRHVTVVEVEPAVVRWVGGPLATFAGQALDDPRVRVVVDDVAAWAAAATERFDALCLDVDNGPDWTVTSGNDVLYSDEGVGTLARLLEPGGALAVWSAAAAPALARSLEQHFGTVAVYDVPVDRGEPDRVLVASRPDR